MAKKKIYEAPALKSEPIQLGVFGNYGGGNNGNHFGWYKGRRKRFRFN